jgi:hypothetical protein
MSARSRSASNASTRTAVTARASNWQRYGAWNQDQPTASSGPTVSRVTMPCPGSASFTSTCPSSTR